MNQNSDDIVDPGIYEQLKRANEPKIVTPVVESKPVVSNVKSKAKK